VRVPVNLTENVPALRSYVPVNLRLPLALASLPVALVTVALPVMLKTCPSSSLQPLELETTLKATVVRFVPVSLPVPPKGRHGRT